MTLDIDSIRSSSSSIIVHDNHHKRKPSLLSCWGCSKAPISRTVEDKKSDVKKGFFKRIQFFKGLRMLQKKRFF